MENNHRRGSAAVAFLIGAVAGGITALLLAPQSGAQTRRRLRGGVHDLRAKGERLAHRAEEGAGALTGAIMGAASEAKKAYRNESDKQRENRAASAKHFGETETAGNKPRTGAQ